MSIFTYVINTTLKPNPAENRINPEFTLGMNTKDEHARGIPILINPCLFNDLRPILSRVPGHSLCVRDPLVHLRTRHD